MFDRTNFSYSLNDFDDDEKDAVLESKQEAVKKFSNLDTVTKIGTGSGGKTIVYKTGDYAVKLFCGITKNCGNKNLDDEMTALSRIASTRFDIGMNFFREIGTVAKLRSVNSIQSTDSDSHPVNLIFFTAKSDILPWKCSRFNRVGVDYAFQMPLVKCLANELSTYKLQNQGLQKKQPEDLATILTIGIDLCDALIVMHKNNIIHQDIKPQNIFLDHNNYCLGDLGIAREEDNRQYFLEGTPAYWSPEQRNGQMVDRRCDIYSLGLVLYELADTVPISAHYEERMHTDKKLPELKTAVPEGLKMILQNACEYEPSLRYQSAAAFKNDLCQLKKNTGYKPKPTRDIYKPGNPLPPSFNPNMSPSRNLQPHNNSHGGAGSFHMQQRANRFFQPETVWRAGKLWYEESRKTGSRFAELKIDEKIMPLSSHSSHVTDFPIRVSESTDDAAKPKRLSDVLKDTENLHNMYLIGEGGIGKTTALNSIMKLKYENKDCYTSKNGKTIIPLFIELSKAPINYCNAYYASHSTFIQRYLYMLLASVQKQHLLSESPKEMAQIMDKQDTSITDNIDMLLNMDEDHTQYLLLLDGLNEVSKKQLSTKEKDFLGSPSELIVEEIKELLEKHKNITVIITSRADETLSDLDDSFERLYLTGVSEEIIKKYLSECKISPEQVSENSRLMETLKIPLFLKLYGELYNTTDISTPGEILYAFFSERSTKYTARNRIAEIKQDHQKAGDAYGSNSVDEKMQWFILDFLLPELGWYMEKNDLYAVDLPTFRQVIDTVLKGENNTDICGTYGRKYFKEYLKGEDPIPNTQTYARQLLALDGPLDEDYASVIAKYCVYSLGILYVNNQSYSFIHQHIRDFFAAMKIITDMKMALYIAENKNNPNNIFITLRSIDKDILGNNVIQYIGEVLHEHTNNLGDNSIKQNCSLLKNILNLYKNIFFSNYSEEYGVWNLIRIFFESHGSLAGMDFSYFDLRNCSLNGMNLSNCDFTGSAINRETLFETVHIGGIQVMAFSPNGLFLYTGGQDGALKIWHVKTSKCLKTIKKYHDSITNISLNENYLAVSTGKLTEIIDINTYEILRQYHSLNAIFSPSGNVLAVFYKRKKIQIISANSFEILGCLGHVYNPFISNCSTVSFSPDNKYIAYVTSKYFNIFSKKTIEIWNIETFTKVLSICDEDDPYERISGISFDPEGTSLVVTQYGSFVKLYVLSLEDGLYDSIWKAPLKREYNTKNNEVNQVAMFVKYLSINCFVVGDRNGGVHVYNLDYISNPFSKSFHFYKKDHMSAISCISVYSKENQLYLATSDTNGYVKIRDMNQKEFIYDLQHSSDKRILCSYYINSTHEILMCSNKEVLIFDFKSGILSNNISISDIVHVSYEDNCKLLAIAHLNNILDIYHYNEGLDFINQIIIPCKKIDNLHFVENGNFLIIEADDKCFYKYDTYYRILKKLSFSSPQIWMEPIITSLSGNTIIYSTYPHNKTIGMYDVINENELPKAKINLEKTQYSEIEEERTASLSGNAVCISPQNSNYLALTGGQVYKLNESTQEYNLFSSKNGYSAAKLFLSDDAEFLAVVSNDAFPTVRIYDNQTQKHLFNIYNIPDIDKINLPISLRRILNYHLYNKYQGFHRFQLTVYYLIDDSENFLKSIKRRLQFAVYKKYNGHQNKSISSVTFVPFQEIFITTSYDGTIKLWKLSKNSFVKAPKPLTCFKTINYISGLKIKNSRVQKLNQLSDLTPEDISSLKTYGAKTDEI